MRCTVVLLAALALVPRGVRAEEERGTASELFRAASAAFERGEYRASALAYEEADRRVPHPMTLCNAAFAWDAAGELPRAADAFHGALARGGLAEPQATNATRRLAELERDLGAIDITVDGGGEVTVAHVSRRRAPTRVHLAAGTYDLRIEHADGRRSTKQLRIAAGVVTPVAIPKPTRRAVVRPRTPAPAPEPRSPVLPILGWTALGVATTAAGVGIYLGVRGLDARDEFVATGQTNADLRDESIALRTSANVAFGSAIVLGGVGITLIIVDATSTPTRSARVNR